MFPPELLEADAAIHRLLQQIAFSRHLNPVNGPQAKAAFLAGAEAPPLLYDAPLWAEDALNALEGLRIPEAHPLGLELSRIAQELRLLIAALQHRSADTFDALNRACNWEPLRQERPEMAYEMPVQLGEGADAEGMLRHLQNALDERGMQDWRVMADPVMSARVLVDAPKRLLRVHTGARFSASDLRALVAHEIDVHALRGLYGAEQPLRLFASGLSHSDTTEEGLAILSEERTGTLSPRFVWRQWLLHQAVIRARTAGFREVYEWVQAQAGPSIAWALTLRIKRGLGRPGEPGVYAKDTIYLRGWMDVSRWLAAGGEISLLYVGKVGIQHPIRDWLQKGWIKAGKVPALWLGL